jgi:hypothetical protein
MSYKNFELQLNKELVDTDEKIEDVISLIAMDSLRSIVKMSPVDTGRFRNKPVKVKEIGIDEMGQPTINGNPILKFRIPKIM